MSACKVQLKLGGAGQQCLSQKGASASASDVAALSAISASSTVDPEAHGANKAVDGSSSTFWVFLFVSLALSLLQVDSTASYSKKRTHTVQHFSTANVCMVSCLHNRCFTCQENKNTYCNTCHSTKANHYLRTTSRNRCEQMRAKQFGVRPLAN